MARKLKTYLTSIGFYDLAIAAPSMKAALEAWGVGSNLFHQGAASETSDGKIVTAAMASPGVVVKRPVGSNKAFSHQADLPDRLIETSPSKRGPSRAGKSRKNPVGRRGANGKTAVTSDGERKRSDRKQAKEKAANLKREQRRKRAVDTVRKKIDAAKVKHEAKVAEIRSQIEKLERSLVTEVDRWKRESDKLEALSGRAKHR